MRSVGQQICRLAPRGWGDFSFPSAETRRMLSLEKRSSLLSAFESWRFAEFLPHFREITGSLRCHYPNLFPLYASSSAVTTFAFVTVVVIVGPPLAVPRVGEKTSSCFAGITRFSGATRPKAARNNFFVCREGDSPVVVGRTDGRTNGTGIARCFRQMKFSKLGRLVCPSAFNFHRR